MLKRRLELFLVLLDSRWTVSLVRTCSVILLIEVGSVCVGGGIRKFIHGGTSTSTTSGLHQCAATVQVLVVSASPVCSSLLGERPYISTVSSARWVGPVPVCREVNRGRVAMWAETVRTGKGETGPPDQREWRTASRKYTLPGRRKRRLMFQSADPSPRALTSESRYLPLFVSTEIHTPHTETFYRHSDKQVIIPIKDISTDMS